MQYHAMALLLNFEPFSQNCVLIPEIMFILAVSHMLYVCFMTYSTQSFYPLSILCFWSVLHLNLKILSTQLYLTQLKLPRFGILIEGNTILWACWPLNM